MSLLKKIAARLPRRWQTELKRIHFARQIRKNTFSTDEAEYRMLAQLVNTGDWVVDIGANVGHYTKRLSELVGAHGRVIAFEPVPTTFSLLSANVELFPHSNVTLINAAVSNTMNVVGMSIPTFSTGLTNYYEARISPSTGSALSILTLSLDQMSIEHRISLVKIDTEGHESFCLAGMEKLILRDHPVMIIETQSSDVLDKLSAMGYLNERAPNSPNVLFKPSR